MGEAAATAGGSGLIGEAAATAGGSGLIGEAAAIAGGNGLMGEAAVIAGEAGGSGLIGEEANEDIAAKPRKATNAAGRITIKRMDTAPFGLQLCRG
jgi:hypothetical protein